MAFKCSCFCYGSFHLNCFSSVLVLHFPICRFLALLAVTWVSIGSTFVDLEILRQDVKYDHDHEITVCLNSDDAKNFYRTPEGANVVWTGCFPARLGGFSPLYRVANIEMITQRGVFGFVYGVSETVTPRTGAILHNMPIYLVTSAVVIDQNQREVLVADLN
jgi:hypothetical protein